MTAHQWNPSDFRNYVAKNLTELCQLANGLHCDFKFGTVSKMFTLIFSL